VDLSNWRFSSQTRRGLEAAMKCDEAPGGAQTIAAIPLFRLVWGFLVADVEQCRLFESTGDRVKQGFRGS
jgi:hypothetical protein